MLATDGVWSTESLPIEKPNDTGTFGAAKPLGGWEHKLVPGGMFAARPGVYFPLNATIEQLKDIRARGLGKATMLEQCEGMIDAWKRGEPSYTVEGGVQFISARHGLGKHASGYTRSASYGEWLPHPIKLSFDPAPKRVMGDGQRLALLEDWPHESVPYKNAVVESALEKGLLVDGEC